MQTHSRANRRNKTEGRKGLPREKENKGQTKRVSSQSVVVPVSNIIEWCQGVESRGDPGRILREQKGAVTRTLPLQTRWGSPPPLLLELLQGGNEGEKCRGMRRGKTNLTRNWKRVVGKKSEESFLPAADYFGLILNEFEIRYPGTFFHCQREVPKKILGVQSHQNCQRDELD